MRDLAVLPKAHLHVHLESTVRAGTLAELAAVNGVPAPPPAAGFAGFREFGDWNSGVRACLRRAEDFERVAVEFCADEAAAGVGYAEVTFTAASHGERLGDVGMPLAAVERGLREGMRRFGIEVRVVLDHSRRRSVDRLRRTVELALGCPLVVAVGVAGEERYPVEPFAGVLAEARAAGLGLVHHAGEDGGPGNVWAALRVGLADRIGHGISVLADPGLVGWARERGVVFEVCPSSNVALGLVGSLAEHPFPEMVEAGLAVTLNTDVPNATGMSLVGEFEVARSVFGLSDEVLAGVARTAVVGSYAPAAVKERLVAGIGAWLGG